MNIVVFRNTKKTALRKIAIVAIFAMLTCFVVPVAGASGVPIWPAPVPFSPPSDIIDGNWRTMFSYTAPIGIHIEQVVF